jgi:hypothetical protein
VQYFKLVSIRLNIHMIDESNDTCSCDLLISYHFPVVRLVVASLFVYGALPWQCRPSRYCSCISFFLSFFLTHTQKKTRRLNQFHDDSSVRIPCNTSTETACQTVDQSSTIDETSLGSCEPGTNISLQGMIWNETDKGKSTSKQMCDDYSVSIHSIVYMSR